MRARSPSRVVSKPAPRRPEPRQRARAARARVVCRERRRRCERGADAVVSSDRPRGAGWRRCRASGRLAALGGVWQPVTKLRNSNREETGGHEPAKNQTRANDVASAKTKGGRTRRGRPSLLRSRARHWPRARRTHTPRGASFAMTIIQYLAALLAVGALLAYLVRPPPARARLAPPRPPRARAREEEATLAPRARDPRRDPPPLTPPPHPSVRRPSACTRSPSRSWCVSRPPAHPEAAPRPGLPRDLARGRGPARPSLPLEEPGPELAGPRALRHDPARVR